MIRNTSEIHKNYAPSLWKGGSLCTTYGIRGTAVSNAVRAVRTATCIFWTVCETKTAPIFTKLNPVFPIRCKNPGTAASKYKAEKCSASA